MEIYRNSIPAARARPGGRGDTTEADRPGGLARGRVHPPLRPGTVSSAEAAVRTTGQRRRHHLPRRSPLRPAAEWFAPAGRTEPASPLVAAPQGGVTGTGAPVTRGPRGLQSTEPRVAPVPGKAMLPQREKAARILAKASKIPAEKLDLVTEAGTDPDVAAPWAAPEEAVPREAVSGAVAMVETSVPGDDGSAGAAMREKPALHYETVRPILALLGEPDALGTAPAGRCVLGAVRRLPGFSRAGSRAGRCCRARSTPHRCPRCGDARCSRAPSCRRARSAATRTRCACCWSHRAAPSA